MSCEVSEGLPAIEKFVLDLSLCADTKSKRQHNILIYQYQSVALLYLEEIASACQRQNA
jgi:hypothetical protein